MKFLIWGAGIQGKRFKRFIEMYSKHEVVGFIDLSLTLQGTEYEGKSIISYECYKQKYNTVPIVICMADRFEKAKIENILNNDELYNHYYYGDCPGEMFFPMDDGIPFDEIIDEFDIVNHNIAIMGDNLFSIVFYDYLLENGYDIKLVFDRKNKKVDYLVSKGYSCCLYQELESKYTVLHTYEGAEYQCFEYKDGHTHIQCRDFIKLKRYKNERLKYFHNKYKNEKRCFIVLTGPSLRVKDLDKLNSSMDICFAVNRSYLVFNKTKWRPQFFVVADPFIPEANIDDLLSVDSKYKFYTDSAPIFWTHVDDKRKDIYKIHVSSNDFDMNEPCFSAELVNGVYGGRTVAYTCAQIAIYMGFKKIYFIGLDFSYKKTEDDDENHFIKGYAATATVPANGTGTFELQRKAYQKVKNVADSLGIEIYNASRNTELDVFPRVDFDALF